jgi:predicted anti-sigma-YlaC factor YlaD
MLTCKELAENASEYLDGNLPPSRRLAVRVHLLLCRHCRDYVDQLALTLEMLRSVTAESEHVAVSPELLQQFLSPGPDDNSGAT